MTPLCSQWTIVAKRGAIFFDRDDVIIQDKGYVNRAEDTVFISGAIDAIKLAKSHGFLVFIVTNQGGVARSYYSEIECRDYNLWLLRSMSEMGAVVDELVYCPSHPEFTDSTKICFCRKPGAGMLNYLINKWHVDRSNSLMIGDKETDVEAGLNASIEAMRVSGSESVFQAVREFVDGKRGFNSFAINSTI